MLIVEVFGKIILQMFREMINNYLITVQLIYIIILCLQIILNCLLFNILNILLSGIMWEQL
jgi:hypothetical protein